MVILQALHSLSLLDEVVHEGLDFSSENFRISNWLENDEYHKLLIKIDRHRAKPVW